MDGWNFIAHKVILSALAIFFKKLLVKYKNPYSLIFMRRIKSESQLLHPIMIKKLNLKKKQTEPCEKKSTKLELFGLNERVIEEAISKVKKTDKVTPKVSYIGTVDFASKVILLSSY